MSIAFHGTPIVPVAQNGRAARITRDSTTGASEDKANPALAPDWYREPVSEIPQAAPGSEPDIVSIVSRDNVLYIRQGL
jgi:hypothetical protein